MEEFIELGLEGADKVIDKHFHKMPDKAFHRETYKHLPHRHKDRKNSKDTHSDYDFESEPDRDNRSMSHQAAPEYRHNTAADPGYSYIPVFGTGEQRQSSKELFKTLVGRILVDKLKTIKRLFAV